MDRKHCAVTSFYKALNELELTNVNPAIGVKKSKTEMNRAPVYMNPEQLRELLVRTEGKYRERNLAILMLMGYGGLRAGEPFLCNDAAAERGRHTNRTGDARTCLHSNNYGLHSRI